MSETAGSQDADFLLESRGVSRDLGAWVVGAALERGGARRRLRLRPRRRHDPRGAPGGGPAEEWTTAAAHDGGACL